MIFYNPVFNRIAEEEVERQEMRKTPHYRFESEFTDIFKSTNGVIAGTVIITRKDSEFGFKNLEVRIFDGKSKEEG